MLIFLVLACGQPVPPPAPAGYTHPVPEAIPEGVTHVWLDHTSVWVDDHIVDTVAALTEDPVTGPHGSLVDSLAEAPAVWVSAPPSTEWLLVRKLRASAPEGVTIWISVDGGTEAYPLPAASPTRMVATCPSPLMVVDVDYSLSFNLHHSSDGTWALGHANFRPIVRTGDGKFPYLQLPEGCLDDTTCDILPGPVGDACVQGQSLTPLTSRVPIGGEIGCLLPIAKQPEDLATWRPELSRTLAHLAIAPETESAMLVEAKVPWEAVLSVFGGFADHGLTPPTLSALLIEGHEGPPICDAPIRDAETLELSRGTWLGSQLKK